MLRTNYWLTQEQNMKSTILNITKLSGRILKYGVGLVLLAVLLIGIYISQFFIFTPKTDVDLAEVSSLAGLDSYLTRITELELPPALDITILQHGNKVFSKAYGIKDGKSRLPVDKNSVYHFYSSTKSFTAVATLKLAEKGVIKLSDDIRQYLPEFNPIDKDNKPLALTIDQLLTHSTGLPDITVKQFQWLTSIDQQPLGDTKVVAKYFNEFNQSAWAPSTQQKYINTNYILLGAMIDAVTEEGYEGYVKQNILEPLGMTQSDFVYREDILEHAVTGIQDYYHFFTPMLAAFGPKGGLESLTDYKIGNQHWLNLIYTDYIASTSLIGTGEDMSRFAQMLLDGGSLNGVQILTKESADKILYQGKLAKEVVKAKNNDISYAIGYGTKTWYLEGFEAIGHGGSGPGFIMQYFVIPEKEMVVVVLASNASTDANGIALKVASLF